jgi:DNA-binding IclR family transcriptional regulator
MPIDIDRFETAPEGELTASDGLTNAERVLSFLAANEERAYSPTEIREATGVARGSIGVVLSRLEERGLVRHRGEYWAIDPEADVERSLTASRTAEAAAERFGPEDPEEWGGGDGE